MRSLVIKIISLSVLLIGPAVAQGRYTFSATGQEVVDSKTSLIWRRCPEGMNWNAKACSGQILFFPQGEAAARGQRDWRLPTLRELSSIASAKEAMDGKAAINAAIFPGTPPVRFWTSSSTGPGYFTFIGFMDGSAGEGPRNAAGAVRLVRVVKN